MAFTASKIVVAASIATGVILSLTNSASAGSFGFEFETKYLFEDAPKGDILLKSVKFGDETVRDFSYVSGAQIVENDPFLGGNTGAASADKGDKSTTGIAVEDATANDVITNLGTNNLNNIIDTEDTGSFIIDLAFDKTIDNLLVWERGMNSDLGIQAVDINGNLIGNRQVITRDMWFDAGFAINTTEISKEQQVGALGINIAN
ncbi:MAG: exosortase-dependent surface protein XDP2, partial [Cyanobacteria bacterium P01_F01_bin.86]